MFFRMAYFSRATEGDSPPVPLPPVALLPELLPVASLPSDAPLATPTLASPPSGSTLAASAAPSPSPELAVPLRWADLVEADDVAAGRPVVRGEPPARLAATRVESVLPPRRGSSGHLSRLCRRAAVVSPPTPGQKAPLWSRTACRRRAPAWGVAGRSNQGSARISWRATAPAALPFSSGAPPHRSSATPASSPVLLRRSPFRPFITTFGSSTLSFSHRLAPRRPRPIFAPSRTPAPAAAAEAAGGKTLAAPPRPAGWAVPRWAGRVMGPLTCGLRRV